MAYYTLNRRHPEPPPIPGARYIQLGHGRFAIVDEEYFNFINQYYWAIDRCGYAQQSIRVGAKLTTQKMHLLLIRTILPDEDFTGLQVDHISGNGLDNRLANLRLVERAQNQWNRKISEDCSSKYKGVCYAQDKHKFRAQIQRNGKKYNLGSYTDEVEAAKVYNKKAKELFGAYARLNIIPGED